MQYWLGNDPIPNNIMCRMGTLPLERTYCHLHLAREMPLPHLPTAADVDLEMHGKKERLPQLHERQLSKLRTLKVLEEILAKTCKCLRHQQECLPVSIKSQVQELTHPDRCHSQTPPV